ncbi:ras-related protein RABF1-like [Haliotis rubra]|uniref:ras-related protein RABF1-like n=1 Tax=Haliotis rubra TaxID=36100 RepID=UPI001EE5E491|nr:ras-related protein RABF1-like [Haliotis rubra]
MQTGVEKTTSLRRHVQKVKVVTVGDMDVGKTCLTLRFMKNTFNEDSRGTVGASFLAKAVDIPDKTVIFQVWDTAGQERFRSLIPMYLRDAKAAIVVYDVTDLESYKNIKGHWLQMLHKHGPTDIRVAIVGNKIDKMSEKVVPTKEAQKFAEDHRFLFIETSALTGANVEKLFYDVAHLLGDTLDDEVPSRDSTELNVQLSDEVPPLVKSRKKCCTHL